MLPKVENILGNLKLSEGPHWSAKSQSLYFVDIFNNSINKYVPETNIHTKAIIDGEKVVSFIIPLENSEDKYLISHGRELKIVTWDGKSETVSHIKKFAEVDDVSDKLENHFCDGKCDSTGRLWAGTMGSRGDDGKIKPKKASLFSFKTDEIKCHLTNVTISNGLAWNDDLKKFYYIDSAKYSVDQYDLIDKFTLENPETVFTLSKHDIPGAPDGMTIDTDGNLWIAIAFGSRVIKIDPRQPETLLETIHLPVELTTSVAFGGPNLDELYVTSGSTNNEENSKEGAIFKISNTGAKGYAGIDVKFLYNC